jgi:hypothetical protein
MMILYGNIRAVKFFSLLKLRFHSKKPLENALFNACKYKGATGSAAFFMQSYIFIIFSMRRMSA